VKGAGIKDSSRTAVGSSLTGNVGKELSRPVAKMIRNILLLSLVALATVNISHHSPIRKELGIKLASWKISSQALDYMAISIWLLDGLDALMCHCLVNVTSVILPTSLFIC